MEQTFENDVGIGVENALIRDGLERCTDGIGPGNLVTIQGDPSQFQDGLDGNIRPQRVGGNRATKEVVVVLCSQSCSGLNRVVVQVGEAEGVENFLEQEKIDGPIMTGLIARENMNGGEISSANNESLGAKEGALKRKKMRALALARCYHPPVLLNSTNLRCSSISEVDDDLNLTIEVGWKVEHHTIIQWV